MQVDTMTMSDLNHFDVYKTHTEYTSKEVLYCSEIWTNGVTSPSDIIRLRSLPNEVITSDRRKVFNVATDVIDYTDNTVQYYIEQKQYVNALHRLMYLSMIMGQRNIDLFEFMKDDGLMHELLHLKSGYSNVSIDRLIDGANTFEQGVPGTLMWVLSSL